MTSTLIAARDLQPGDVIRSNVAPHVSDGTPRTVTRVDVFDMINGPGQGADVHVTGAPWPVDRVAARYLFVLVSRAA